MNKVKSIDDIVTLDSGWTIGKFLHGNYRAKNGQIFDENSISIELIYVTDEELIEIAEDICNLFNQESVIVKTYSTCRIMFVNGEKVDKCN